MELNVVKVCGITNVNDACFAANNGATALGFIFVKRSPRCIDVNVASTISAVIPKGILRVGVFSNESAADVREIARVAKLNVVQLHGDEVPEYCTELEGLRIWKAFPVRQFFDPDVMLSYDCEACLLDTVKPSGGFGGSGLNFQWSAVRDVKEGKRIIIAGGLDGDNVGSAIRELNPWGVDASSRLESSTGVKDPKKVLSYLKAAKTV